MYIEYIHETLYIYRYSAPNIPQSYPHTLQTLFTRSDKKACPHFKSLYRGVFYNIVYIIGDFANY